MERGTGTKRRAIIMSDTGLDFSKLFNDKQDAHSKPTEQRKDDDARKLSSQELKCAGGDFESFQRVLAPSLIKKAVESKTAREEAVRICKDHQANTAKSQILQSEILKGVKAGEDIVSLFLKAAQIVSLTTNNSLFYTQVEKDLLAIYGEGLHERGAVSMELGQVLSRLERLTLAEKQETDPDNKERIGRAVTAHRAKAVELERLLAGTDIKNVT